MQDLCWKGCVIYPFRQQTIFTIYHQALLRNGKRCLADCGRTGISLSELKPSLEARNLLRAVNLPNTDLTNVVIVEEEASIASTDEETIAEKEGPRVFNPSSSPYQTTSVQNYAEVKPDKRQGLASYRSNTDRIEDREGEDPSRDSTLSLDRGRYENQEARMNSRGPEYSQDGDGFRRVRLVTEGDLDLLGEKLKGHQEQGSSSSPDRLGFLCGEDHQSPSVSKGGSVNNSFGRESKRRRQEESLLPAYTSWERGTRAQKNNNPESWRFEDKRRKPSATSTSNTGERERGRFGRSRSRERSKEVKEKKQRRDSSREKSSRESRDKSRSRDRKEEVRSRNRKKPALKLRSQEEGRRSRENERSRSREVKSRSREDVRSKNRPKLPIQEDERRSREIKRSRSREEARSRSKDLRRSKSRERVGNKSGQTVRTRDKNLVLDNFSPISSNPEEKGDGGEKGKEENMTREAKSKKGVQWKCKGEVGAGREAHAGFVQQIVEEDKSQISKQCAVKTELVPREIKRPKQVVDEIPKGMCALAKGQVKREVKALSPELIVLGDEDIHCDYDNNPLIKQFSEYVEEEPRKEESPQDSLDKSLEKSMEKFAEESLPEFSSSSVTTAHFLENPDDIILGGEQVWTRPDNNLRLSISSDSRPQEDENATDHEEDSLKSLSVQDAPSLKLVNIESMKPEKEIEGNEEVDDIVVPLGGCICDQFKYRPPSSSWEIEDVVCFDHQCHPTKIVGVVSKSANSHTFLAELTDQDGVLAGRSVKFCPRPPPETLAGTFVQLRKVFHKKYILLAVDCPWDKAEEVLTSGTNVGICQTWLGENVEDLTPTTDIPLTCESMESDADGVLSLTCSTPLHFGRSMPFVIVVASSRLKISDENRLCSVSKNGMVSLTCRDQPELGSQSIESLKATEIGTITNIIDNKFMEIIIRKVLLKNMEVVKKGPSKKLSLKTDVPSQRKKTSKVIAKSPARMKFGVKTAIKVKPASTSSSSVFGDNAESDDETCSNSSNASSSQASSKSVNSLGMRLGAKRLRRTSSPGKLQVQNVKSAKIDCATGKSIPTVLNTQPVPAIPIGPILSTSVAAPLLPDLSKPPPTSELNTPPPMPDLNKPPPSFNLSRPPPSSYKMPTFLGMKAPPPGCFTHPLPGPSPVQTTLEQHQQVMNESALVLEASSNQHEGSLPKCSKPLPCIRCQLNPNSDIVRCPSCPQYTVILDQDLALPTDTPVVGEVKVEGLKDGPYVKIFSLGGTIHIPDSLNLAFSHNPDATPKRVDDTVTMNFLNTGLKDILLEKGTPVTRAQLLTLGS